MNLKEGVEKDILSAVQVLYRESKQERPIITRTTINREIMENPRRYPNIQPYNLSYRRKQITTVCNRHYKQFSQNWRNGAWVVTEVGVW